MVWRGIKSRHTWNSGFTSRSPDSPLAPRSPRRRGRRWRRRRGYSGSPQPPSCSRCPQSPYCSHQSLHTHRVIGHILVAWYEFKLMTVTFGFCSAGILRYYIHIKAMRVQTSFYLLSLYFQIGGNLSYGEEQNQYNWCVYGSKYQWK